MAEMIGNRYLLLKQIGKGGMANVYLAQDTILKREVALKILHTDQSADPVALERFRREAGAATSLAHPNIVDIYDVGEDNGRYYIVMEYIKGYTLKQLLQKRGPLPCEETVWLMKQLASALLEAHRNGIIHRDVKSQNVLIKADGTVKLSDFGIAISSADMNQITTKDAVVGSVHYIAPECAKGQQATVQSDIYSLGIVFYETLMGDVPYKADQPVKIAMLHITQPLPSLRAYRPEIPQAVENIIIRATAKKPENRYKNMLEMLNDLKTCLSPEHANDAKLVLINDVLKTDKEKEKIAQQQQKEAESRKRKTFNIVLISAVTLVSVIMLIAILTISGIIQFGNKTVKVPDISNLSVIEADDMLDEYGLSIDYSSIERQMTEDIEAGKIISFSPAADTPVDKGSKIKVLVSEGKYEIMPNYVGSSIDTVKDLLTQKLFLVNEIPVESDELPGTIVKQEGVLPNDKYNPNVNNAVTLYYSQYRTMLIPFGTLGKNVDEVEQMFMDGGFKVTVQEISVNECSEKEKNFGAYNVVRITPQEGTSYRQEGDNTIMIYYYKEAE